MNRTLVVFKVAGQTYCTDKNQKIIIVSINNFSIGFSVDDISGIIHVNSDDIEVPPDIVSKTNIFSDGVVKSQDNIIILLDFNRMLNDDEIEKIETLNRDISLWRKNQIIKRASI